LKKTNETNETNEKTETTETTKVNKVNKEVNNKINQVNESKRENDNGKIKMINKSDRIVWKGGTMLYPLPVVLITCGDESMGYNIFTVAWTGILSTNPPLCYISVRPERHSYNIIKKTGSFAINLTNKDLLYATDYCGVKSGRDTDKFAELKLELVKSNSIDAPSLKISPLVLECKVKDIQCFGSHDAFIADIVSITAKKDLVNSVSDSLDLFKAEMITYCHGKYYYLGNQAGKFGYSVEKSLQNTNLEPVKLSELNISAVIDKTQKSGMTKKADKTSKSKTTKSKTSKSKIFLGNKKNTDSTHLIKKPKAIHRKGKKNDN